MNVIQESMKEIQASEELKKHTLQYLEKQKVKKHRLKSHFILRYALIMVYVLLLLGAGGYSVYKIPVSYISIDINPSIELEVNRFGKVVSAKPYNEDGKDILQQISLKNISYIQAIHKLLTNENYQYFLSERALLVFTVVSDSSDTILENIEKDEISQIYKTLTYTSDTACMEEAHHNEMSFGKYRAYLELSQEDKSVTIEDCHEMTIGEIQDKIEHCKQHNEINNEEENHQEDHDQDHYEEHNSSNNQSQVNPSLPAENFEHHNEEHSSSNNQSQVNPSLPAGEHHDEEHSSPNNQPQVNPSLPAGEHHDQEHSIPDNQIEPSVSQEVYQPEYSQEESSSQQDWEELPQGGHHSDKHNNKKGHH